MFTAVIGFGTRFEVQIVDVDTGPCVVQGSYGEATSTWSWPEP